MSNCSRLAAATLLVLASVAAVPALARPNCGDAPREKWLSETEMKAKAAALGYRDIRTLKVSKGCYEIYARTADGRRAEVYFHPVTGEPVKTEIE